MSTVTIFKNFWDTKTPRYVSVDYVLNAIKTGNIKDQIVALRNTEHREEKSRKKKYLPCVLFSGSFGERTDNAIIKHSGIICLDFDKFDSDIELINFKHQIQEDKYVYSVFDSPSGNGVKVLVKITNDVNNHRGHFHALREHFNHPNWDDSCINESRICFMSYDPNIYINENSSVFENIGKQKETIIEEVKFIAPDENEVINRLYRWWTEKYGMVIGQRNRNVYILAMAFNEFGVSEISAGNFLSQLETDGFSISEIRSCVSSAYKKSHLHGTKQFSKKAVSTYKVDETVEISSVKKVNVHDMYSKTFIDVRKPLEKQPLAISIGTHTFKGVQYPTSFGTFGNFSCIVGAAKSKKTFFKSMLNAAFIDKRNVHCGHIYGHREREMFVVDIDTEQSMFDSQRVFKRVMDMVGKSDYEYYLPFSLRGYSPFEMIEFIEWLIYESDYKDNIGFMSIDGIADLTNDFNDLKESQAVIRKIMKWTDDKQFHLTSIIHSNFGTGKPTGHLGTSVLKKAETICMVEKADEEVSLITFPYTRSMAINDLKYSVIDGIPVVKDPLADIKTPHSSVGNYYEKEDVPF